MPFREQSWLWFSYILYVTLTAPKDANLNFWMINYFKNSNIFNTLKSTSVSLFSVCTRKLITVKSWTNIWWLLFSVFWHWHQHKTKYQMWVNYAAFLNILILKSLDHTKFLFFGKYAHCFSLMCFSGFTLVFSGLTTKTCKVLFFLSPKVL